jgi:hypothetical protein
MKDLPAMVWIIGAFILLSVATIVYARSGMEEYPTPENAWMAVEQIKDGLKFRRLTLAPEQRQESLLPPYRVRIDRLPDVEVETPLARYLLQVRPLVPLSLFNRWMAQGVDIGLIDERPSDIVGAVRMVAFRKLEGEQ